MATRATAAPAGKRCQSKYWGLRCVKRRGHKNLHDGGEAKLSGSYQAWDFGNKRRMRSLIS